MDDRDRSYDDLMRYINLVNEKERIAFRMRWIRSKTVQLGTGAAQPQVLAVNGGSHGS